MKMEINENDIEMTSTVLQLTFYIDQTGLFRHTFPDFHFYLFLIYFVRLNIYRNQNYKRNCVIKIFS